jgi:hypothetical protein
MRNGGQSDVVSIELSKRILFSPVMSILIASKAEPQCISFILKAVIRVLHQKWYNSFLYAIKGTILASIFIVCIDKGLATSHAAFHHEEFFPSDEIVLIKESGVLGILMSRANYTITYCYPSKV